MNFKHLAIAGLVSSALAIGAGLYMAVNGGPDSLACFGRVMPSADVPAFLESHGEYRAAAEVCSLPRDPRMASAGEEEEGEESVRTDRPEEAVRYRQLAMQSEDGAIRPDGFIRALKHAQTMPRAAKQPQTREVGFDWEALGPGNVGGRARALVIHPTQTDTMYLGSVSGGIWKTTNGGASWAPLDDYLASISIGTLAMHPINPNILYAGTGEWITGFRGAGVLKSSNAGRSWTQLPATDNEDFRYVNRIAISANGTVILAATNTGLFRSTNAGLDWTRVSSALKVVDVKFHPTDSNRALAGTNIGILAFSDDGGANFVDSDGFPTTPDFLQDNRMEIAFAKSNPNIVYVSSNHNNGEIWKSNNKGEDFTLVNTGNQLLGGQGAWDNALWVDPTNAARLVVGGVEMYRSVNGGGYVTKIGDLNQWFGGAGSPHADNHAIVHHPDYNGTTNRTVFAVSDGGIYKAADILTATTTTGWTPMNNNLAITQFYGAAGNPTNGNVVGGTQDNGSQQYRPEAGANDWRIYFGGDGGYGAVDWTDPNYLYGEYVYLSISRATNRLALGDFIVSGNNGVGLLDDAFDCALFIAPFILDPNKVNRMLAGGCSLWRSNNVKAPAPLWSAIKSPIAPGEMISTIAVAKGNPNRIWLGYTNGDIYRTSNGTAATPTWVKADKPNLPDRFVSRIAISPANANTIYASFGGFDPDNLWSTESNGTSWTDRTGAGATGLPDAPIRSIAIHPINGWLYAGTEVGLFGSEDNGANWSASDAGPANISVDDVFFMNTALVAATHGRGIFKSETEPCVNLTLDVSPEDFYGTVAPAPAPNCVSDPSRYSRGTVVTATATPNAGLMFDHWSGASTSTNPVISLEMLTSKSLTANFLPQPGVVVEAQ